MIFILKSIYVRYYRHHQKGDDPNGAASSATLMMAVFFAINFMSVYALLLIFPNLSLPDIPPIWGPIFIGLIWAILHYYIASGDRNKTILEEFSSEPDNQKRKWNIIAILWPILSLSIFSILVFLLAMPSIG